MKIISYNPEILKIFKKNDDDEMKLYEWWGYFEDKIPACNEVKVAVSLELDPESSG
jgi:hypothetical protein